MPHTASTSFLDKRKSHKNVILTQPRVTANTFKVNQDCSALSENLKLYVDIVYVHLHQSAIRDLSEEVAFFNGSLCAMFRGNRRKANWQRVLSEWMCREQGTCSDTLYTCCQTADFVHDRVILVTLVRMGHRSVPV